MFQSVIRRISSQSPRMKKSVSQYSSDKKDNLNKTREKLIKERSKSAVIQVNDFLTLLFEGVDQFFPQKTSFTINFKLFLTKSFKEIHQKVKQRLDYVGASITDLKMATLDDIETAVATQWKRNPALFSICSFWCDYQRSFKFNSIQQIKSEHKKICSFIKAVTEALFESVFEAKHRKKFLQQCVIPNILTIHIDWIRFFEDSIFPLCQKAEKLPIDYLKQIEQNPNFICQQNPIEQLYPLINQLKLFVKEHRLKQKCSLLKNLGKIMQQCVNKHQIKLIKLGKLKNEVPFLTDEALDILKNCILFERIQNLEASFIYIQFCRLGQLDENLQMTWGYLQPRQSQIKSVLDNLK